jgi:CO dehydrogenase maturation factor
MTKTIALAGKGGVGKTTIAGLTIKYLVQKKNGTVLAIDADPSSNLHMVLGLDLEWTIGDIREDMLAQVKESLMEGGAAMGSLPGGVNKHDYLDYQIRSALSEGERVDLIVMGRPEGPGCYCAVNHNLREVVDAIGKNYQYVVIDNEAGMEHLSRRTTRDVDYLLIISDPTLRGLVAAERISTLADELNIRVVEKYLILNRIEGLVIPDEIKSKIKEIGINFAGFLPNDRSLTEYEYRGKPIVQIPSESLVYEKFSKIINIILSN